MRKIAGVIAFARIGIIVNFSHIRKGIYEKNTTILMAKEQLMLNAAALVKGSLHRRLERGGCDILCAKYVAIAAAGRCADPLNKPCSHALIINMRACLEIEIYVINCPAAHLRNQYFPRNTAVAV